MRFDWRYGTTVIALLCLICSPRTGKSQIIGGEVVYQDAEKKVETPAPGVRIFLVAGAYDPKKGVPSESKRLDQDLSASVSTGHPPRDVGTFVLMSKDSIEEVTILFYPWTPTGQQVAQGLLSRVVAPRVMERDGVLRAKVRLNCRPTDGTLASVGEVVTAIQNAATASHLAKALDISIDTRKEIFRKELRVIVSMIDPEKREMIVAELKRNPHMIPWPMREADELIPVFAEEFFRDAGTFKEIRVQQADVWRNIRATPIEKLSFERPLQ